MDSSSKAIVEQGVLTLPASIWDEAKKRLLVIAPLAAAEVVGHQDVDEAAHDNCQTSCRVS
jgi:putative transposase